MSDKVCPSGHVYEGTKCARDNWEEPSAAAEVSAPVESKSVQRRKAVQKTPKAVKVAKVKKAPKAKKVAKSAKKSKKSK